MLYIIIVVKIITLSDDENGEEGFTNIVINEDEIKPQHKLPPYSRSCSMETDGQLFNFIAFLSHPKHIDCYVHRSINYIAV